MPRFSRLKGTRNEGRAVANELHVAPMLDAEALEGTVKACQSPRVLHFATHGFFFEATGVDSSQDGVGRIRFVENPMLRSGLALAGANAFLDGKPLPEEAEDGILTAEDVSGLDLRATDLVVLSACETGLGEVRSGEGVFGLRRAFALAGARTLIVSLWKVADGPTAELMTQFYRELGSSQQPAAALKRAQMALRSMSARIMRRFSPL